MKYRQFNTAMWADDYVYQLNDKEFKAFIFYDKNERVNMCGIYEMSMRMKTFYLNMEKKEIESLEKKFESDRIYYFYQNWIYLPNNHMESQYSTADNIIRSYNAELKKVPFDVKDYFFNKLNLKYIPPFDTKKTNLRIDRKEMVMVIEMKGNESRLGGRVGNDTDVIDVEQISKDIDRDLEIEKKLKFYGQQN